MPRKKRLKIKHNPYAVKGAKIGAFSGGVITKKPLPDGRILVTVTDQEGRRIQHIEEVTHAHH